MQIALTLERGEGNHGEGLRDHLRTGVTCRNADRNVTLDAICDGVGLHGAGLDGDHAATGFGNYLARGVRDIADFLLAHVIHAALLGHTLPFLANHSAGGDRVLFHAHFRHTLGHATVFVADMLFGHHAANLIRHFHCVALWYRVALPPGLIADVLLGHHFANRVWNLDRLHFGDVVTSPLCDELDVALGHHPAGGVGAIPDVALGDGVAACPRFSPHAGLRDHLANRVRDLADVYLGDLVAVSACLIAHALLGHCAAYRPSAGLHFRLTDLAANGNLNRCANGLAHQLAFADSLADFFGDPDLPADGPGRALNLFLDNLTGAIVACA
jgi:hypothetical protein